MNTAQKRQSSLEEGDLLFRRAVYTGGAVVAVAAAALACLCSYIGAMAFVAGDLGTFFVGIPLSLAGGVIALPAMIVAAVSYFGGRRYGLGLGARVMVRLGFFGGVGAILMVVPVYVTMIVWGCVW